MSSNSALHVVVLTGNEKQAKRAGIIQGIVDTGSSRPIRVELITPDGARNWGPVLKRFSRSLTGADAAVLGTFVPTELGAAARREVRRLHIPHIRTSKLGQHGIADAALAAVELVETS